MSTKKERMYQRIEIHGEKLKRIFKLSGVVDPVALCKKLRTIENKANWAATQLANGQIDQHEYEHKRSLVVASLRKLLGLYITDTCYEHEGRLFINSDPRGYALKLPEKVAKDHDLYRDWGGYGIIAPDLTDTTAYGVPA